MQSINRNTVDTMLDHLWTKHQTLTALAVICFYRLLDAATASIRRWRQKPATREREKVRAALWVKVLNGVVIQ